MCSYIFNFAYIIGAKVRQKIQEHPEAFQLILCTIYQSIGNRDFAFGKIRGPTNPEAPWHSSNPVFMGRSPNNLGFHDLSDYWNCHRP